jgi:hypothetical protein
MTSTDYIIDIGLIALVALQLRGRRLSLFSLLLPLVLVSWAAETYLSGVPTAGNDLVLVGAGTVAGLTLGTLCGLFTSVRHDGNGSVVAKAGAWAALFWVLGVGTRFAFQMYATHGGGAAIVHFSAAHGITSNEAWVATLILMAIGEVVARTAVIGARAYRVAHRTGATLSRGLPRPLVPVGAPQADQDGWQ